MTQAAISAGSGTGTGQEWSDQGRQRHAVAIRQSTGTLNVPKMLRCAAQMEKGQDIRANEGPDRSGRPDPASRGPVIHHEPDGPMYFFGWQLGPEIDTWLVRVPDSQG